MDCLHYTAEETGSKRLEVVPKDSLANNWQKETLAPILGFQILCPISYTIFAMLPYLNMILNLYF